MQDISAWQQRLLNDLSTRLQGNQDFLGLVLYGSYADDSVTTDEWSDIDLMAIVSDEKVKTYFSDRDWLDQYGTLIGLDRHSEPDRNVLRVVFDPCRRVDMTLVPESILKKHIQKKINEACKTHKTLWSRIQDINQGLPGLLKAPIFAGHSDISTEALIDTFWFKASVSIAKTARKDLLVGMHLALDLARDCLVLQMIRRDNAKGTNVHRFGGFGNEIVNRVLPPSNTTSQESILELIKHSMLLFDELAKDVLPNYHPRSKHLIPAIQQIMIKYQG